MEVRESHRKGEESDFPQNPLTPLPQHRGLRQQQQLLTLPGACSAPLLSGSVLQRALYLQQLQGLDQFAVPPATYDSTGLTMPTATLGNLSSCNFSTLNLTPISHTPHQLVTPNLQQLFPQAVQQSLLGPPPFGAPFSPSQVSLFRKAHQKQIWTSCSVNTNDKRMPVEDKSDPAEGSEDTAEAHMDSPACLPDSDSCSHPADTTKKRVPAPEPEACQASGPPAKRSKSSKEDTEKSSTGQLQAKVQPWVRMTALLQAPEPQEAGISSQLQPSIPQTHTQGQHQYWTREPPVEAQTQAHAVLSVPQQMALQTEEEQVQPPQQPPEPPPVQPLAHPSEQTRGQPQTKSQTSAPDQAPVPGNSTGPDAAGLPVPQAQDATLGAPGAQVGEELKETNMSVVSGPEEASLEPVGAQGSMEDSPEEPASGLEVGARESRSREPHGVWGAGVSLKVTIQQSSDSRAFSTVCPMTGLRSSDSASATPAAAGAPSKQNLQFFCYICKANCSSQQDFQQHMVGAQHQQRLRELQHTSQACLLSLLPVSRDVLEKKGQAPLPCHWCNTCQVYYFEDLIQHRRAQDHKIAKQSLRPFCTVCNRYFKTPRKFVEHVKSQGHKDKAKEETNDQDEDHFITVDAVGFCEVEEEEKEKEEEDVDEEIKVDEEFCKQELGEIAGQDEDHFITVDAVGCFEGEDDEDDEIEVDEEFCKQVRTRDISIEEWKGSETYSPNTAYGVDFLVPVMGYICRICRKFYHSNSGAQLSHCKSLAHFENLQNYKKAKNPSPTTRPVSRRCAINARNALTTFFKSGGRTPTQPTSQDTTKTPQKVTTQHCDPPLPRRSTRLNT
ncbi:cip1-interacting zinc finger protein-like [Erinaceus europaeus]|uniref:Cip1-interacting zinc finger protein-like n=1 Tax=Erinaceus europaeus TaxID=9365 RepID=A0ABM3Y6T3_ERIEU|nr:cip1-interacting zinc finger protein-like [Erinaceus europaeus]